MRPWGNPRLGRAVLRWKTCAQVADVPTVVLATDLEAAWSPCGLSYSPVWPWSCHQQHLLRDSTEVMPTCAPVNSPATLTLAVDTEAAHDPALALLAASPALPHQRQAPHAHPCLSGPPTSVQLKTLIRPIIWLLHLAVLSGDPPEDTFFYAPRGCPNDLHPIVD